jgi:translation initiation factor 2 alpha subunit (eIF-2alpha)
MVKMKDKIKITSSDSNGIKSVKRAIARDLAQRYQNPTVQLVLNKASFLDPQTKTLPHLSPDEQESVLDSLVNEIVTLGSSSSFSPVVVPDCTVEDDVALAPPRAKKL